MTELANLLPALVGAVLGTVALLAAHSTMKRLQVSRQAAHDARLARAEADEPELPMALAVPAVAVTRGFAGWYGGGTIVPVPGKKREKAH